MVLEKFFSRKYFQEKNSHYAKIFVQNFRILSRNVSFVADSTDSFKFPPFSIKNFLHFSVQLNCKNNIINIRIFQIFISLYFKISEQNVLFTFLLFYYLNSTVYEKLVLLPNSVNA